MEQVYQFKLDPYIHYYDYQLCDEKSDDDDEEEKSTAEYSELVPSVDDESQNSKGRRGSITKSTIFDGKRSPISENEKLKSLNCMQNLAAVVERRRKSNKQLPKSINSCLDEFTKKIAKAKSFH